MDHPRMTVNSEIPHHRKSKKPSSVAQTQGSRVSVRNATSDLK